MVGGQKEMKHIAAVVLAIGVCWTTYAQDVSSPNASGKIAAAKSVIGKNSIHHKSGEYAAVKPAFFDTVDRGDPAGKAPSIQPWKRVALDPNYSGAWVITGDINGDGQVEIVSARNVNVGDVHYTSAAAAQRLDGQVLWRWGNPNIGRRGLHHDVACQIYDWDGDGTNEVVVAAKDCLVELDGVTGKERRRLPIPPNATDCLVFANLSGRQRATDVLVKDRYGQIWALDYSGKLLWTVRSPGGFTTAHQPIPVDIDADGRDEIMAGYAMLNPDGQIRWTLADAGRLGGHADCCRILRKGKTPQDWRLVVTCCGGSGNKLLAFDGNGKTQWVIGGHHFESIDIGKIHPQRPGPQILVDLVDTNALWGVDENGELLGQLKADYSRFHTLVDWNGDGYEEIVLPHGRGIFDFQGRRIGTFAMETQKDLYGGKPAAEGEVGNIVLRGDMDGDGVPDITITAPHAVYVFKNEKGRKPQERTAPGCGTNFTLY
jgi:hypothetical protein